MAEFQPIHLFPIAIIDNDCQTVLLFIFLSSHVKHLVYVQVQNFLQTKYVLIYKKILFPIPPYIPLTRLYLITFPNIISSFSSLKFKYLFSFQIIVKLFMIIYFIQFYNNYKKSTRHSFMFYYQNPYFYPYPGQFYSLPSVIPQ